MLERIPRGEHNIENTMGGTQESGYYNIGGELFQESQVVGVSITNTIRMSRYD